jgi:hypothetical protein
MSRRGPNGRSLCRRAFKASWRPVLTPTSTSTAVCAQGNAGAASGRARIWWRRSPHADSPPRPAPRTWMSSRRVTSALKWSAPISRATAGGRLRRAADDDPVGGQTGLLTRRRFDVVKTAEPQQLTRAPGRRSVCLCGRVLVLGLGQPLLDSLDAMLVARVIAGDLGRLLAPGCPLHALPEGHGLVRVVPGSRHVDQADVVGLGLL